MYFPLTANDVFFHKSQKTRRPRFWPAFLAFMALWAPEACSTASAAITGKVGESGILAPQAAGAATDPQVLRKLSGSTYPGVVNCLLANQGDSPSGLSWTSVHINYPSFGNVKIDGDIREWVGDMANSFSSLTDFALLAGENDAPDDMPGEAQNGQTDGETDRSHAFELWGDYHISRPSPAAVSIAFEIWNYMGPNEGNLDIITLNYNLVTGQRLNFVDIFEKPDVALELMANWSRKELGDRIGAAGRTRMLEAGTEPVIENYSSITLTPEGIRINFQPLQVAPGEAGIQTVNMPLEELMPSLPMLDLWGRG